MEVREPRERILTAAGPIFATRGFERTTVREICLDAGVNLASVNYYFGDKEQLYIEVVRSAHQRIAGQVPLPDWPQDASPEQKLHGLVHTLLTRMIGAQSAPWQSQLMMREVMRPTSACRSMVEDYFRPHFELLLSIIDEFIPAETATHRRHQIGLSIIGQCLYYRVSKDILGMLIDQDEREHYFSIDQLAKHITEFSSAALKSSYSTVEHKMTSSSSAPDSQSASLTTLRS